MLLADCIALIERTAPLSLAAEWEHSGMQIASDRTSVNCIAVSLDPSPHIAEQAVAIGADLLLTHHPLLLKPRFPNYPDAWFRTMQTLIRADIPHYAAHTTLDANPQGPSAWLADALGLTDRIVLEPYAQMDFGEGSVPCGFGLAGTLPDPMPFAALMRCIGSFIDLRCARMIGSVSTVRRLAVCPGSGSDLAQAAADAGADLFITGDMKYHPALEAPLPILDAGHFSLEHVMIESFAAQLASQAPELRIEFLPSDDPFHRLEDGWMPSCCAR